ncbi:hypothetical protein EYF80_007481 [Liparis tanakae]|uniref:Uncharacterized protein n=1 Tax=Liparis tanakae TaxID=230148 RepID=A0A4Z2IWM6_9TELE|nr:hypothetical protein EYF80_007481 [Liparis tanakae]
MSGKGISSTPEPCSSSLIIGIIPPLSMLSMAKSQKPLCSKGRAEEVESSRATHSSSRRGQHGNIFNHSESGSEIGKAHVGTLPPLYEVGHTVFALLGSCIVLSGSQECKVGGKATGDGGRAGMLVNWLPSRFSFFRKVKFCMTRSKKRGLSSQYWESMLVVSAKRGAGQSLVGKGLTHSVGNVLGADAKDVEHLLGLSAAGNTSHCQPGHNDARLLAHC